MGLLDSLAEGVTTSAPGPNVTEEVDTGQSFLLTQNGHVFLVTIFVVAIVLFLCFPLAGEIRKVMGNIQGLGKYRRQIYARDFEIGKVQDKPKNPRCEPMKSKRIVLRV